ncbi:MAG: lipoyl(octanoyl) transferase LipB [Acidobacteria bacterium]|nr:lipoyl(octanoyl) transferase LipB [Acidobacteriota bacterium]
MISVLQLGTLDYATGLGLQEKLLELRKDGRIGDVLLLLEHTPVITLGRNAKSANILASPEALVRRGVEVFECDRGGDVTFHGPGQLVAYPIFDLRGFPSENAERKHLGAIEYVRRLEEVLIRTCREFGIPAKRIPGLTGVWTAYEPANRGAGERSRAPRGGSEVREASEAEAKIAALGVHISRGITSHGVALNVNTDLDFFNLIIPCGITSKPVTSMRRELGREVSMRDVAKRVGRNFGNVFHCPMLWLESLEALVGGSLGIPMKIPPDLRRIHGDEDAAWA